MKQKIYFLILYQLLLPALSQASPYYEVNDNIVHAQQLIYSLKPQSAEKLLQAEEKINPRNGYITFYRFYSEVVDLFISNSPDKYKKNAPKLVKYIEMIEKMPKDAPEYKMFLGEAKVYAGTLNVRYGSKLPGLLDCLKGFKLLESNRKEYPSFDENKKMHGLTHVGFAFIPKFLQWTIKLLGIRGDAVEGLKELSDYSKYAEGKPGLDEEALLLTMGAYKIMNQDEIAMGMINKRIGNFKEVTLINYLAASICLESNEGETALGLLSNIKTEELEMPFPPIDYLTGKAKLLKLDPQADILLNRFIEVSDGHDFMKATLYNEACFYYAFGRTDDYRNCMAQVKLKGREIMNRDLEAVYEAQLKTLPNYYLLRTGLLIRGGYTQEAQTELANVNDVTKLTLQDQVRYFFLLGEYNRLINNMVEAEKYYLKAIGTGREKNFDDALEAMVKLGLMKEMGGLKMEAEKYFRQCIQSKNNNTPFSELYIIKAKAGLIRLSHPV